MSIISAVKSFFSLSPAVPEIAATLTGAIVNATDALFYTQEEKVGDEKEVLSLLIEKYKVLGFDTLTSQITRRILVSIVTGVWALGAILGLILCCLSQTEILKILITFADAWKIGWAFVTIFVFYFGRHMLMLGKDNRKK